MPRATLEMIKADVLNGNAIQSVADLTIITPNKNNLNFTVKIGVGNYPKKVVAAANGRVRVFKNVDDVVTAAAKFQLTALGLASFVITNPEALDPKPFDGDVVARARKERTRYVAIKEKLEDDVAELTAAIALMPSVTVGEQLLVTERSLQRTMIEGSIAYYVSEIARITAAVGV